MSKRKTRKKVQRIAPATTEQVNEEKKSVFRYFSKDLLASVQLFIPSFFSILLTAEMLKYAFDVNVQNLVFPALVLLLGLSFVVYTCLGGWLTRMPFLVLPNYFYAFLFVVVGKNYIGYSLHFLLIGCIIGLIAFFITSFFIKKDLWVKWVPDSIMKFLPLMLGMQLILFGLMQSGIVQLSVLDPIRNNFGELFLGNGSYFLLSTDNLVTPAVVLLVLGIACYLVLKKRNVPHSFLWTIAFILAVGFILPIAWRQGFVRQNLSSFRSISPANPPYRPQIISMIFSQIFGENGAMNWAQWQNFFSIRGFVLLRFSFMTYFFMIFYSIFMHQNIQQVHKKTHPDLDRKDISDAKLNRFHAFSGLAGILSSVSVFSFTEHSIFALFAKGKTFLTSFMTSAWVLLAILIIPLTGLLANPSLIAFIWIVFGVKMLESFGSHFSLKHLQDFFVLIPMLIVAITTMNFAESLLVGIFLHSLFDIATNYKNKKQAIQPSSFVWIVVVIVYYLIKVNAF